MSNAMKSRIVRRDSQSLVTDTRGLTTVEYVIILVLIAVGCIGLWGLFQDSLAGQITDSTTAIGDLSSGD